MMKVLHARPGKNEGDKPFWTQVGIAFPREKGGVSMILNYVPLHTDKDGAVRLLVVEDDGERKRPAQDAPLDDEVPF